MDYGTSEINKYYSSYWLQDVDIPVRNISTEDIREYLVRYQAINNCSKVTSDNIRRNISSFFSWLEEEDYILKSLMRRIHKIRTKSTVKETISDEAIDKGMSIEQVQKLLGHSKIDTTLGYAMVNEANVKHSHQKYIN